MDFTIFYLSPFTFTKIFNAKSRKISYWVILKNNPNNIGLHQSANDEPRKWSGTSMVH